MRRRGATIVAAGRVAPLGRVAMAAALLVVATACSGDEPGDPAGAGGRAADDGWAPLLAYSDPSATVLLVDLAAASDAAGPDRPGLDADVDEIVEWDRVVGGVMAESDVAVGFGVAYPMTIGSPGDDYASGTVLGIAGIGLDAVDRFAEGTVLVVAGDIDPSSVVESVTDGVAEADYAVDARELADGTLVTLGCDDCDRTAAPLELARYSEMWVTDDLLVMGRTGEVVPAVEGADDPIDPTLLALVDGLAADGVASMIVGTEPGGDLASIWCPVECGPTQETEIAAQEAAGATGVPRYDAWASGARIDDENRTEVVWALAYEDGVPDGAVAAVETYLAEASSPVRRQPLAEAYEVESLDVEGDVLVVRLSLTSPTPNRWANEVFSGELPLPTVG